MFKVWVGIESTNCKVSSSRLLPTHYREWHIKSGIHMHYKDWAI